jgi:hypothetical protein
VQKQRPRRTMTRSDAIPEPVIVAALHAGKASEDNSDIFVPVGDTDVIVAVTRVAKTTAVPEHSTFGRVENVVFVHLRDAARDAITLPWNTYGLKGAAD